jgi:hypothetical protein
LLWTLVFGISRLSAHIATRRAGATSAQLAGVESELQLSGGRARAGGTDSAEKTDDHWVATAEHKAIGACITTNAGIGNGGLQVRRFAFWE